MPAAQSANVSAYRILPDNGHPYRRKHRELPQTGALRRRRGVVVQIREYVAGVVHVHHAQEWRERRARGPPRVSRETEIQTRRHWQPLRVALADDELRHVTRRDVEAMVDGIVVGAAHVAEHHAVRSSRREVEARGEGLASPRPVAG